MSRQLLTLVAWMLLGYVAAVCVCVTGGWMNLIGLQWLTLAACFVLGILAAFAGERQ